VVRELYVLRHAQRTALHVTPPGADLMTLTQLRYIVAIADAGLNITLAADNVHATQSGISKQLKQLEGELGFQVFTRRGKSLDAITPAGSQVLERARSILHEARNIRALAANLREEAHGELSLATTHTQARFVLPEAIARLKQHYPDLSVHIRPQGEGRIISLFESGEVDLVIVSTSGTAPEGGIAVPLFRWYRRAVVPHGHPLAKLGRPLRIQDLAEYPLVSYESSLQPESSLRRVFANAGLSPRIACTSVDADLIKTYVLAGLGVGILAEMAIGASDARELVTLDIDDLLPVCTSWLVLRRDHVLRSYVAQFARLIAPQLDEAELRRVVAGHAEPRWPQAPLWSELQPKLSRRPAPRAA
jgi:LysR family transcriptional regulator, cys regulon transcriptional activator